MARDSLVGEGGVLQHTFSISEQLQPLLRDAYSRWRFEDLAFPFSLAVRGFDGRETFPDYPHREDGLLVSVRSRVRVRVGVGLGRVSSSPCASQVTKKALNLACILSSEGSIG